MTTSRPLPLWLLLLGLSTAAAPLLGCDDTASMAVVVNRFDDASIYKLWWNTTLIADPVPPGQISVAERTVPADGSTTRNSTKPPTEPLPNSTVGDGHDHT